MLVHVSSNRKRYSVHEKTRGIWCERFSPQKLAIGQLWRLVESPSLASIIAYSLDFHVYKR